MRWSFSKHRVRMVESWSVLLSAESNIVISAISHSAHPHINQSSVVFSDALYSSIERCILRCEKTRRPSISTPHRTQALSSVLLSCGTIIGTFADLEKGIEVVEIMTLEQQHLVIDGRKLEDDRRLNENNIGTGSTVHMVAHLRGC
jgi:Ubiquitin family